MWEIVNVGVLHEQKSGAYIGCTMRAKLMPRLAPQKLNEITL
jgi:hypothetical protein